MSKENDQLQSALDDLIGTVSVELPEIKAILESIPTGPNVDVTLALQKIAEAKVKIANMSNQLSPNQPAEGLHNVSLGFRSEGEESFSARIVDNNCDDEQAANLKGLYEAAKSSAQNQSAGGASFKSTLYFEQDGEYESFELDNAKQKAAADKAIGQAIVALAEAQLAE